MIACAIFDLDDTLFSERQFVESGLRAVHDWQLPLHGAAQFLDEALKLHRGPSRDRLLNRAFAACGIPESEPLIEGAVRVFREHLPTLTLHDDARFLLDHFKGRKRMGVISDGYLIPQQNKVAVLNLAPYFEHILYCESFGREFWRPHPRAYQHMMELMGGDPSTFAYIADNPLRDFIAPNALGWQTFQIERPENIYYQTPCPPEARPQRVVSSLRELAEI